MSGDYSRHRFNPRNHYAGVKMQQGRVQLDADWNEWTDAMDRRTRAESVDTFGVFPTPGIEGVAVVSPQTPNAFRITVNAGNFTIGQGRMYVDGLLAENFGDEKGPQDFDPVMAELRGQNPITYDQQPYHPDPVNLPTTGPHLAYLETWQREVTHLQQPDLLEKAISVDTTTRTQTVWQVRLLEDIGSSISCTSPDADLGTEWDAIIAPSAGRLSSQAVGVPADEDPCELPPSGGYRGLENQLYRIEIHDGGSVGSATFKWSRENASVAASVVEVVSDTELKLASLGRDAVLRFNTGDWVEIIDDWRELSGVAGDPAQRIGEMRQITVDDAKQTISFSPALPANLIPTGVNENTLENRHLRVVRWDQKGVVRGVDSSNNDVVIVNVDSNQGLIPVPAAGIWVTLENGVQVRFSRAPAAGDFRCNDYWTIAARTADASVEVLNDAPPQAIHRHYARLALVTFPVGETDCRKHWPPDCSGGCCTVTVEPGGNIQQAIDSLPVEGGCICLKTGVHEISAALEIHASHIKFHGESPGTIVRAITNLPYLLEVGSAALTVTNIEVLGIRFEVTVPAEGAFVLYLNHCSEVHVDQCELEVMGQQLSAHLGILMQNVRDVVISANRLLNLLTGIWVNNYRDRLIIENNVIEGISMRSGHTSISMGKYGIRIDTDYVVPCHIEHNQIDHFWTAIWLRDGAQYSHVTNNRITRTGDLSDDALPTTIEELRTYLDNRFYAIGIEAGHCTVQGNYIGLPGALWGGIRTTAQNTVITDNILRSSSKVSAQNPLPASIYGLALADQGGTADYSQIANNKLLGPQTGIVISRINEVTVENNLIEGMSAGWFGVRVDDCNNSRICGNTAEDILFGINLSTGNDNLVCDNHIIRCGMGITSVSENSIQVINNTVSGCVIYGIMLLVTASANLNGNQVSNCGYGNAISLGIAVFAENILVESEAMVRIEGNEVLDTGINPLNNSVTTIPAISISALCAACNISHNHTDYTSDILNAQLEHRGLMLIGPLALTVNLANARIEYMFGSAVVTDNHFRGPARSYLVDFFPLRISDNVDFRFEKVNFTNNICNHLNAGPQEDAATVRLWGRNLIAMGNHIKANTNVNAMSLGNRNRVALMGNITTGGYIRVGTTTPAPLTDFNIRT